MGFSSSPKLLLRKILHLRAVSVRSSGVSGGNISHFQRGLFCTPGSKFHCIYASEEARFANRQFLNRFIHATGSRQSAGRDYYEVLGVSYDANLDEIKKAFHALAKKYHPDANRNNTFAKKKFQEIRDAYEVLQNPEKKAQYDKMRESSGRGRSSEPPNWDGGSFRHTQSAHFSDSFHKIFSEIFENGTENMAADIQVELALTFSEASKGCTKSLSFDADVPCDLCDGQGHPIDVAPIQCPTCRGSGSVKMPPFSTTCSTCKGLGRVMKEYCFACKGTGVFEGLKEVKVIIPAGVDSEDTIRVPKAGNAGGWGRSPSNLYIKLKVADDPIFSRQGADIYVDNYISFTQAILGGEVEIPTLSGKIQLQIPKGVQPGHVVLLRGKGLPRSGFLVDHGDQYVCFRVKFPSTVSERQRAILEEFEEEIVDGSYASAEDSWWQWWLQREIRPKLALEFSIFVLILLFLGKVLN